MKLICNKRKKWDGKIVQPYENSKYCTKIEKIILKNCVSSYTIDINKSAKTITKILEGKELLFTECIVTD